MSDVSKPANPEFSALKQAKPELVKQLSYSFTQLKDQCLAANLISCAEMLENFGGRGATPACETSLLLDMVLSKVEADQSLYSTFMEMSLLHDPAHVKLMQHTGQILEAEKAKCQELSGLVDASVCGVHRLGGKGRPAEAGTALMPVHQNDSTLGDQPHASNLKGISDRYHRTPYGCGCGNCSLETYLEGGCSKPMQTATSLPYLDTSELSKGDADILIGRLLRESSEIALHFQELVSNTVRSLQAVPLRKVKNCLRFLKTFTNVYNSGECLLDRFHDVESAEDIDDVFGVLGDYMSFINPDILEQLIKELCKDEDTKKELEEYKQHLQVYCKRRVVECPCEYASSRYGVQVTVKKDTHLGRFTLEELLIFQSKLSKILQLAKHTLRLCEVREGCTLIKYRVPPLVAEKSFPLCHDQEMELQHEGVLELSCGDYHYHDSQFVRDVVQTDVKESLDGEYLCIALLPTDVLLVIATYLSPEDVTRFAQTCRRLYSVLPRFLGMRGEDFDIQGPNYGHWVPEHYFDGPQLPGHVKDLTMSVIWKDQGWGNRKGEIYVTLVDRLGREVAEHRQPLGIAPHREQKSVVYLKNDPVVTLARPGDYYKFTRNVGGSSGHQLIVKGFKAIAQVCVIADSGVISNSVTPEVQRTGVRKIETVCTGDEKVDSVAERICHNTTSSFEFLTGCRMTPCGAKAIAGGLRTNTSLRFLDLTDCVTDDDLQHLAEALCTNRTLESLTLGHNYISSKGATYLACVLTSNTALKSLDLTDNKTLGDDGVQHIAMALCTNTTLESLLLKGSGISSKGAAALAVALESNTTLKTLDLWENHSIGNVGVRDIAKALHLNRSLETLNLGGTRIFSKGAMYLATALEHNTTIKYLNLSLNLVKDDGVQHLATVLESNKALESLDLRGAGMTAKGAAYLSVALQLNGSLKELDLSENNIQDDGTRKLAEAVQVNKTLRSLSLDYNHITSVGASSLAVALRSNVGLRNLNLRDNVISDDGVQHLAESLHSNKSLQLLNLGNNHISSEGASFLAEALPFNTTLRNLWLWDCPDIHEATRKKLRTVAWSKGIEVYF